MDLHHNIQIWPDLHALEHDNLSRKRLSLLFLDPLAFFQPTDGDSFNPFDFRRTSNPDVRDDQLLAVLQAIEYLARASLAASTSLENLVRAEWHQPQETLHGHRFLASETIGASFDGRVVASLNPQPLLPFVAVRAQKCDFFFERLF